MNEFREYMDSKYFDNPEFKIVDEFDPFKFKPEYAEKSRQEGKKRDQYKFYPHGKDTYFERVEEEERLLEEEIQEMMKAQQEEEDAEAELGRVKKTEEERIMEFVKINVDEKIRRSKKRTTEKHSGIFFESVKGLGYFWLYLLVGGILVYGFYTLNEKSKKKVKKVDKK